MSFLNNAKQEIEKRYGQLEQEMSELELKTLNAKYKSLEARDTALKTCREKFKALKERAADGKKQVSEFSDDSDGAWNTFREGMENVWKELRTTCSKAASEFKDASADDHGKIDASEASCSSSTIGGQTTIASPDLAASGQCAGDQTTKGK